MLHGNARLMRLCGLILAIAIAVAGCGGKDKRDAKGEAQYPMLPKFEFKGADGKLYDQQAFYNGVGVMSFVASWCGPCRTELKELDEYARKYAGVIALAATYESPEFYRGVMESLKAAIPVIQVDSAFFVALQVSKLPTRILIDHGKIVLRSIGAPSPPDSQFTGALEKALGLATNPAVARKDSQSQDTANGQE